MRTHIYFYVWLSMLNWNLSNGYRNSRLQEYLCADDRFLMIFQKPFTSDRTITLTDDRESAAILTQTWNTTLPGLHTSNNIKYDCKFRVQTPKHTQRGIYTIITRLKFRTDVRTGECIDYIQFFSGSRVPSERICNDIAMDGQPVSYDARDRDLHVHVHIDAKRMISEPLELNMVLTAHSECRYTGDFLCNPKDSFSCISRYFVRDNITNCEFPCLDEVTCPHYAITTMDMDTTNVALSAITSLIMTMAGVGFCVWICWKYWNCITVQQHAHEASAAAARQRSPRDATTVTFPSAPTFDDIAISGADQSQQQQQQQPQTPKDLPPSYESLFPDR